VKSSTLLALVLLAFAAPANTQQFKFTSLDFPDGSLTTGRGINDHGDIVGAYRVGPGVRHALLIKKGQYFPIAPETILGAFYSEATDINDRGDLVGQMVDWNGFGHGFLVRDGLVTVLDFPGATETFALSINGSGLVAGYWDVLDAYGNMLELHSYTWKDGVFTQFDFPWGAGGAIFGINDGGDMVGVWLADLSSDIEHGFACPKNGACFSFDVPVPGSPLTQADAINEHGHIVGVDFDADGVWHAFLMVGANFTSFDYPGATLTAAFGINSAGQIVGKYTDANGVLHGFLAEPINIGKPQ